MTKEEIPPIKDFVFVSDKIKKLVIDLETFHQFRNQASVKLYEKWKGKDYFKGTLQQMSELSEAKELFDMSHGKHWQPLISTIYLLKNYETDVPLDGFHKLSKDHQLEIMDIITKGQYAKEELEKWLKPINKKNVFKAIYDAVKISLGNDKYDTFQILKFGEIKSVSDGDIRIHEDILEIDNPSALIEYFKNQSESIHDSFILTFMRHPTYDYKPMVYIIFIWKSNLYVIDFAERRLNIDNTAGARTGGARFYEVMEKIWLPWDMILDDQKNLNHQNKRTKTVVLKKGIMKRGNIFEVFKTAPEIKAWIEMFTIRLVDYILHTKNKIELGYTITHTLKQLEDKSKKQIPIRVKTKKNHSSFDSQNDASSYLLEKYSSSITNVIPSVKDFPMLIGKKKYLQNLVKYKQRVEIAKNIQKEVKKDFKKNHKRVYKWLHKFIKNKKVEEIVKRALKNKEYPFKYYSDFADGNEVYIQGRLVKINRKNELQKSKILTVYDSKEDSLPWIDSDDLLGINIAPNNKIYDCKCQICFKYKFSILIELNFIDYRQLCGFFNLKPDELPSEYIQHFHYQNEAYVGNSILDDTDPVDEVKDIWFRANSEYSSGVIINGFSSEHPHIDVRIPICRRCYKKCNEEANAFSFSS